MLGDHKLKSPFPNLSKIECVTLMGNYVLPEEIVSTRKFMLIARVKAVPIPLNLFIAENIEHNPVSCIVSLFLHAPH